MHDPAEKPPQLHLGHPGLGGPRPARTGATPSSPARDWCPVPTRTSTGYVIHLPVRVNDLDAATMLARVLAERLGSLTEFDAGETTISTVDDRPTSSGSSAICCCRTAPAAPAVDHSGACRRLPGPPPPRRQARQGRAARRLWPDDPQLELDQSCRSGSTPPSPCWSTPPSRSSTTGARTAGSWSPSCPGPNPEQLVAYLKRPKP